MELKVPIIFLLFGVLRTEVCSEKILNQLPLHAGKTGKSFYRDSVDLDTFNKKGNTLFVLVT